MGQYGLLVHLYFVWASALFPPVVLRRHLLLPWNCMLQGTWIYLQQPMSQELRMWICGGLWLLLWRRGLWTDETPLFLLLLQLVLRRAALRMGIHLGNLRATLLSLTSLIFIKRNQA